MLEDVPGERIQRQEQRWAWARRDMDHAQQLHFEGRGIASSVYMPAGGTDAREALLGGVGDPENGAGMGGARVLEAPGQREDASEPLGNGQVVLGRQIVLVPEDQQPVNVGRVRAPRSGPGPRTLRAAPK